ncbi:MAG: hypothetical protein ABIR46_03075 [Candidatus Saccharimonadales bacterium]
MARVVRLVSDISGKEADEKDFTKMVVRVHPSITEPKLLDVLADEVESLKGADNLVTLELGENGDRREVVVSLADFRKLVKDDVVASAPGTRGRRKGFSPTKA